MEEVVKIREKQMYDLLKEYQRAKRIAKDIRESLDEARYDMMDFERDGKYQFPDQMHSDFFENIRKFGKNHRFVETYVKLHNMKAVNCDVQCPLCHKDDVVIEYFLDVVLNNNRPELVSLKKGRSDELRGLWLCEACGSSSDYENAPKAAKTVRDEIKAVGKRK